jgi:2-polyprenyl-6-hydroxyphenyl methylase/3-demethylubiquinone-9 3-methyltransferase
MDNFSSNIDKTEIDKFDSQQDQWWDLHGDFQALHDINPVRVAYINHQAGLAGKSVLDVGCGGGILSEAMCRQGAMVTGIDASSPALSVAKAHAQQSGLSIDYVCITAEALAESVNESAIGHFGMITCMELVEHVPYPESLINACSRLTRPGGDVFFATINRTPVAYLLVILAAEYIFGIVRKGMHDYRKFVRPAEMKNWAEGFGLDLQNVSGMRYIPFIRKSGLCKSVSMNYLMHFRRR